MRTLDETKTNIGTEEKPIESPARQAKFHSLWFTPIILLVVFIFVSMTVLWLIRRNTCTTKQNQLINDAESTAESIRLRLNGNQDYLLMIAKDRGDGFMDATSFQERASRYVADHPEMICINWVNADYLITDVAPIAPNKQIVGLRLNLPEPKRASQLAMEKRQPVYTRPFDVIQGEFAFELWVPVFHNNVFLGLFGGIYSYEKMLYSIVSPHMLKTYNVSVVDASGKVLMELPRTGTVDEKLVHRVSLTPPENGVFLQFKEYSNTGLERSLLLMELVCLICAIGIVYVVWRLRCEVITSRQTEEALRYTYEYIQQLISSANVMIIGLDVDGRVRMFNKAAEKITGYTIEELTDISWFEKIVPRDRYPNVWETFRSYQEEIDTMPTMFENPILTKSGEERFISWQNSTISTPGSKISTISFGIDITERKCAEEELKRSNDMLRAIIEAAPTAIIGLDLDGNVHSVWNPAAEKMLGWSAREVMGRPLPSVPVERQDEFSRFREQIRSGKTLNGMEVRREKRDGTPIDYSIYASPLHNTEGHITGNIAILVDITERRQVEETLRRSTEEIHDLYNRAPCGYHSLDSEGFFVRINDTELQWLGYTRNEIIGKIRFSDLITARSLQTFKDNFSLLKERGWVRDLEFEIIRKDGTLLQVLISATAICDPAGNYLMSRSTVYDITRRKETQEALQISEERYRKAQAIGHVGNWEYNLQTIHFWGSDEARRIYGFDPRQDDFSTDEVENCIPERERVHQALIDLIEADKVYDLEFEIHPRNSSESRIITSIAELQRDEHGNPLKVVGVIQDVTKRKQAEEEIRKLNQELEQRVARRTAQLKSANRELEAFSYSVAHDLQAPLRSIDGFSQILLEKYQDRVDAQGKNYLQRVRSASQRMEQLIDDLLNLSRVSRSDMNIQQVNLSEVAREVADDLHRTHPERRVEFVIQEGIKVQGDGRLLRIVLENLIGNGWKFTSKHPTARIEFGMEQQKKTPVYFVRDDGAGFDMKYGQKLFGPFQRLHSRTEFSGTGIGLATVQRIIHRHCGNVWAEGEVEKGATFYFTIQ